MWIGSGSPLPGQSVQRVGRKGQAAMHPQIAREQDELTMLITRPVWSAADAECSGPHR